jgi:hypothetical protein
MARAPVFHSGDFWACVSANKLSKLARRGEFETPSVPPRQVHRRHHRTPGAGAPTSRPAFSCASQRLDGGRFEARTGNARPVARKTTFIASEALG